MTDYNCVTREEVDAALLNLANLVDDRFTKQTFQTGKLLAKITWLARKIGLTDDEWDEMNEHAEMAVARAHLVVREEYEQKEGA